MNLFHEGPSDGSLAGGARYEVKRKEERKLFTFYDFFQGLLEALWGYPRREIPPNIASTVEVISIPRSPTGGVPRPGPRGTDKQQRPIKERKMSRRRAFA